MRWQGCIRYLAKGYDDVYVECKKGHELLYKDFANKLIRYEVVKADTVNCSVFKGEVKCIDESIKYDIIRYENFDTVEPCVDICDKQKLQLFIQYGQINKDLKYDLVIHARNDKRKVNYGDRNWPLDNWIELVNKLNNRKIASIGTKTASFHVPETDDLRDISLSYLSDVLASSKLCVGPSSGPIHFASLCGCRHLVWTVKGNKFMKVGGGAESSRTRYEKTWNPISTPCTILDEWGWLPPVDIVFNNIIGVI